MIEPIKYTQEVWYLLQINQSLTNQSVVAETLRKSLQITQEARKNSIVVTNDLAIAKIAMQIQKEESPVYDNIFIAIDSFHIEMSYFKAPGKTITESRGPFLLQECQVALKSFVSGLSVNDCIKFLQQHLKLFISKPS